MKIVIVSGHFNPLHGGHLDYFESAKLLGDKLLCIVSNDDQQLMKKKKIILDEQDRFRLIDALKCIDVTMLSLDTKTPYQLVTLRSLRNHFKHDELLYVNGGDRIDLNMNPEKDICDALNIKLVFGVGSEAVIKRDSSSRINLECGEDSYFRSRLTTNTLS